MKIAALPLVALIALTACDSGASDAAADQTAATGTSTPDPAAAAPMPTGTATAAPPAAPVTAIPAALHGRWGLVPADCTSTRGAKGLLTIDGTTLRFYESVGTLDGVEEASDTRLRGSFDFMGEGMTWERDVTLEVQDNGRTLIRRESGEDAAPEPFRYTKCA